MTIITYRLTSTARGALNARLKAWTDGGNSTRLFAGDASLWTNADESRWLGWLDAPATHRPQLNDLTIFSQDARAAGIRHVLLIGMGGSSLCPEVLNATIGPTPGAPRLVVLDSTDPARIRACEAVIDLDATLFIVASKSGSTLEPNMLAEYFWAKLSAMVGAAVAAERFVAITDPGSALEALARSRQFARVFAGSANIGGRYSALSNFGLVPAALLGIDLDDWLTRAEAVIASSRDDDAFSNTAVQLGIAIATLALAGRDKLTLDTDASFAPFGAWLEQLVDESLGKNGRGIIVVDSEALGNAADYGHDRVFCQLRLAGVPDTRGIALAALHAVGHPVISLEIADCRDLAGEFMRWSIATAVAAHVLGVNPFDQPDVESAKLAARAIADRYESTRSLGTPIAASTVTDLLDTLRPHDYLAILAFIEMNDATIAALAQIRLRVRDAKRVATTVGFGPRYLHSSGQLHKGGPSSVAALVITVDEQDDIALPDRHASFGVIKLAQAYGDIEALRARGRRVVRIHLGGDVMAGLRTLDASVTDALR